MVMAERLGPRGVGGMGEAMSRRSSESKLCETL